MHELIDVGVSADIFCTGYGHGDVQTIRMVEVEIDIALCQRPFVTDGLCQELASGTQSLECAELISLTSR